MRTRCDSFVVKTNIHFPTDINLLYDAIRKAIELTASLFEVHDKTAWRQKAYNIRGIKKAYRLVQKTKRSTSKNEAKKLLRDELIVKAHQDYLDSASAHVVKVEQSLAHLMAEDKISLSTTDHLKINEIKNFISHAKRQVDQTTRRVILQEKIPHDEKVFSIFQPHTEWISKGKAGVPVEFGLRVCIIEDQDQFILYHKIAQKQTDDKLAIPMIDETKQRFQNLTSCSFDKGFYTKENHEQLNQRLELSVLPKKGKLSKKDQEAQNDKDFVKQRHQHSAVESAINALQVHGLDKCCDHGIDGFERYVALAVVARNIQRLGAILIKNEKCLLRKRHKLKKAA